MSRHLDDDTLEQYLLGFLAEWRVPAVEEHILACPDCAQRAEELDAYLRAARKALHRKPN